MQIQTKKTLRALMVCLPIVISYFFAIKPNVFTYPLIHANIFHLIANVWCLYFLMKVASDCKTWVLFIIGGAIASVISYLLYNNSLVVGASGFIYGVIGVCTVYMYNNSNGVAFYRSAFFLSVLASLVLGIVIPGLAGLLHLYAIIIGVVIGAMSVRINRFITKIQQ